MKNKSEKTLFPNQKKLGSFITLSSLRAIFLDPNLVYWIPKNNTKEMVLFSDKVAKINLKQGLLIAKALMELTRHKLFLN